MSETTDEAAKYYDVGGISTWDFIVAKKLNYLEGNIVKYIVRWHEKVVPNQDRIKDLKKARDYLNKLIEGATRHAPMDNDTLQTHKMFRYGPGNPCGVPNCEVCTPPTGTHLPHIIETADGTKFHSSTCRCSVCRPPK